MISHQFCGPPIDMETSIYRKPDFPRKINHPSELVWYPHIYQKSHDSPCFSPPWMDMIPGFITLSLV